MNINLEYYKIFYFVAKEKSITGAAKQLCISQPAVSQAIKSLEQHLETELFVRQSKGVRFTKEGELLFSYISQGYEMILLGESQLEKMKNLEYGEVRIGASDMTLQFYLLPYLERFHQLYPGIKVTVTNAPTPQTLDHLQQGRIDFGVVTGPIRTENKFEMYPVRKVRDIFVGGEKFRKQLENGELEYRELQCLPIICLEGDTSTRRYVDACLRENEVKIIPEFELATSDMIVQFAKRNLGIGSVVEDFAKPYIESGELFELRFREMIPSREMFLAIDQTSTMSTAASKLKELLISESVNKD